MQRIYNFVKKCVLLTASIAHLINRVTKIAPVQNISLYLGIFIAYYLAVWRISTEMQFTHVLAEWAAISIFFLAIMHLSLSSNHITRHDWVYIPALFGLLLFPLILNRQSWTDAIITTIVFCIILFVLWLVSRIIYSFIIHLIQKFAKNSKCLVIDNYINANQIAYIIEKIAPHAIVNMSDYPINSDKISPTVLDWLQDNIFVTKKEIIYYGNNQITIRALYALAQKNNITMMQCELIGDKINTIVIHTKHLVGISTKAILFQNKNTLITCDNELMSYIIPIALNSQSRQCSVFFENEMCLINSANVDDPRIIYVNNLEKHVVDYKTNILICGARFNGKNPTMTTQLCSLMQYEITRLFAMAKLAETANIRDFILILPKYNMIYPALRHTATSVNLFNINHLYVIELLHTLLAVCMAHFDLKRHNKTKYTAIMIDLGTKNEPHKRLNTALSFIVKAMNMQIATGNIVRIRQKPTYPTVSISDIFSHKDKTIEIADTQIDILYNHNLCNQDTFAQLDILVNKIKTSEKMYEFIEGLLSQYAAEIGYKMTL